MNKVSTSSRKPWKEPNKERQNKKHTPIGTKVPISLVQEPSTIV
jgi:hypothetical protein